MPTQYITGIVNSGTITASKTVEIVRNHTETKGKKNKYKTKPTTRDAQQKKSDEPPLSKHRRLNSSLMLQSP
jgi:hypothetical protein